MALLTRRWKKLRWSVEQRGWPGTVRVLAERIRRKPDAKGKPMPPHPFDVLHGVDTGGLIGGGDLTAGHAHDRYITGYTAIAPSRFAGSIARWQASEGGQAVGEYAFVDLGCGKGRAVLLASAMGFREVVGVELNPALTAVAEANVAVWQGAGRAERTVRVVCGDAVQFELPPGPCLVYLANPFGAPVVRRLLERLEARAMVEGVPLDVIYQNLAEAAVFC